MGLLDGQIAAIFGAAFGGLYLDGTLHRGTGSPIYAGAVITGYTGGGDQAIKVQVDSASDAMRRAPEFVEGDARLIILAQGMDAISVDHEVTVRGQRYRIRSADLDPGASHYVCRARPSRP